MGVVLFFGAIGMNIVYDLRLGKASENEKYGVEQKWMIGFYTSAFVIVVLALVVFVLMVIPGTNQPIR